MEKDLVECVDYQAVEILHLNALTFSCLCIFWSRLKAAKTYSLIGGRNICIERRSGIVEGYMAVSLDRRPRSLHWEQSLLQRSDSDNTIGADEGPRVGDGLKVHMTQCCWR